MNPSESPAPRGDTPGFLSLAAKRRATRPTPYSSKSDPGGGLFQTKWSPGEEALFEKLLAQDNPPPPRPRQRTPYEPLGDPSHDNPRCACPIAIQDRPCEYLEIFINLDQNPPPLPDAQPNPELENILSEAARTMSNNSGHEISIPTSGRILIDGEDPGNTKEVLEWAARFKPHGDSCHCRAYAPHNPTPQECPNPTPCQCHHRRGPVIATIATESASNVTITRHPPAA